MCSRLRGCATRTCAFNNLPKLQLLMLLLLLLLFWRWIFIMYEEQRKIFLLFARFHRSFVRSPFSCRIAILCKTRARVCNTFSKSRTKCFRLAHHTITKHRATIHPDQPTHLQSRRAKDKHNAPSSLKPPYSLPPSQTNRHITTSNTILTGWNIWNSMCT